MPPQDIDAEIDAMLSFKLEASDGVAMALNVIAKLVDASACQRRRDGLDRSLALIDECCACSPAPGIISLLHYFAANAWSALRSLASDDSQDRWEWEQPEFQLEVFHLRLAMKEPGFSSLPVIRRCQILTNLGNLLSTVGRFVEAIEYWNRAIRYDRAFGMALGNRGHGLLGYARSVYDDCHRHILLRQACLDLREAIKQDIDASPKELFRKEAEGIAADLPEDYRQTTGDLDGFSLGPPDEEKYRRWCLTNTLFLNSLNDIGDHRLAARDVLTCPSVRVRHHVGPSYHGFFNQMSQEFVSARYLLFEGTHSTEPHFSDREVLLHDTFDYPAYSLALEKVKLAFRSAYSLLDKIAFFVNDYFNLAIPQRRVSFGTLWFLDQKPRNGIRSEFQALQNWPMRGLYWLAKDLVWDDDGHQRAMEPDAQALRAIRNHAEHKYLKLHESWSSYPLSDGAETDLRDTLAYSMNRQDFEAKSLRMLKMARAALIYLALGIHREEECREAAEEGEVITIPLSMGLITDEDKV